MAHFSEGWLYRATITVTPPALTSALSNYPLMVKLDSSNFDFDNAKEDGTDIRFALTNGAAFLPHELVSWEAGSDGVGVFYVLLPSLPIAGLSIHIYSGNESATDASAPATVWAEYEAVVHMIRDENGDIHESKSGLPLTLIADSGDAYPASQDGLNHKAEYFDGDQEATYWKLPDGLIPDLGPSSSERQDVVALEVVAKANVSDSVDRPIVSQGVYNDGDISVFLERYSDLVYFLDGPSPYWANATWALITALKNSESVEVAYCNAVSDSYSGEDNDPADPSVYIGGNSGVTTSGSERAFKGWIEEVRIAFFTRTAEWHDTIYKNLVLGTMVSVGTLSMNPESGADHFSMDWIWRNEIIINSETASEGPCIVRLYSINQFAIQNLSLSNGTDIRFALKDGIGFLPYEREKWNVGTAEEQWAIRLPHLEAGETTLYLYFGNYFEAEDGSDSGEAWAGSVQLKEDASATLQGYYKNPNAIHDPNFSLGFRYRAPILVVPADSSGSETLYDVLVEIPLNSSCEGEVANYPWYMLAYSSNMYGFGTPKGDGWYPSSPSFYSTFTSLGTDCPDLVFTVRLPELPPEGVFVYMYWAVYREKIWDVIRNKQDPPGEGEVVPVDVIYYRNETNPANANTWPSTVPSSGLVPAPPTLGEELPEEIPSPPSERVVDSDQIISASFSYEGRGVGIGNLTTNSSFLVGEYVTVEDPLTDEVVFSGIVTKCTRDYKTGLYKVNLSDPLSALTQGEVLFRNTYLSEILHEVTSDYNQSIVIRSSNIATVQLAPVAVEEIMDPDNEIESEPVATLELFRTAERATGGTISFRPDFTYYLEEATDRGELSDSQIIQVVTGIKDRYANRVICKASGEWWEVPEAEEEGTEWIRGAYMNVRRFGDQIREITLTTDDLVYHEEFTYDGDYYLIKQEVTITRRYITPLSQYEYNRTTTVREWDITDEANYEYTEDVIDEVKYTGAEDYIYTGRTLKTTTITEGSVIEEFQRYGWNYEDSDWHVLMNDYEITGSGDSLNTGEGSYYIIRGFTPQPGLNAYSVKSVYEYYYTDEIAGEYDMRLQKTEVLNSCPTIPSLTKSLPLRKYSVSYCVVAEDLEAQAALGLKEVFYTPVTVKDDSNLTTMKTIAENTLAWHERCRLFTGEVPLSLAETWHVGDTFTWGGLTWTIEYLDHDLKGRTSQVTATAEASIAWLQKSLFIEKDRLGNSIKGIVRKETEKYDNVRYATIIRMIDSETYVVQLDDGTITIAHMEFGLGVVLAAGTSVVVLKESLA